MEIKVSILSKETIKPSSPNVRNNVNLSIIDQSAPTMYTPFFVVYGNDEEMSGNASRTSAERSQKLKKSFAETLSLFYPFAGEIKGAYVECNDKGSVYVDARVDCFLSDFLKDPDVDLLEHFIPCDRLSREAASWPLLTVQANFFKCGGFAICLSLSHKITDGASIAAFIGSWAAMSRGSDNIFLPEFNASKFFPAMNLAPPEYPLAMHKGVCKRYVFEWSKILELKARVASKFVPNPTRVEAIIALILKCATKASNSAKKISMPSAFLHITDLRKQNIPLLSENTIGNLVFNIYATTGDNGEIDLQRLVSELRRKKHEMNETCKNLRGGEEASLLHLSRVKEGGAILGRDNVETYTCSGMSNIPFYEYDFGWGKPKWISPGRLGFKNNIILLDAKDGKGIEAFIFLSAENMAFFEGDQELLEFASLNPGILSCNLKSKI